MIHALIISFFCDCILASGNVEVTIERQTDISTYTQIDTVPMVRACGDSVLIQYGAGLYRKFAADKVIFRELE